MNLLLLTPMLWAMGPRSPQPQDLRASAPDSIFERVFPHPDGQNGFEQYARAADVIRGSELGVYLSWTPSRPDDEDLSQLSPEIRALTIRLKSLSLLDVYREEVQRFGRALDLIRAGNDKPAFDPRTRFSAADTFPEYARYRSLGKLMQAEAYVKFADGDTRGGVNCLLDGLKFSTRLNGPSIISALVSVGTSAIFLAAFEDLLPMLGLDDCRKIQRAADSFLQEPNPLIRAVKGEMEFQKTSVGEMLKPLPVPPAKATSDPDDDPDMAKIQRAVADARPQDLERWKGDFDLAIDDLQRRLLARVSKPESSWMGVDQETEDVATQIVSPAPRLLFTQASSTWSGVFQAIARMRTQLRLLEWHGRILESKWRNGKLPGKLTEIAEKRLALDPLSNQEFVYERERGSYRLYSRGAGGIGEIDLRYRRRLKSGESDDGSPKTP